MKKLLLVLMMVLMASVSFGTAIGVKGGYAMYTGDADFMKGFSFGADVQFSMGPLVIAPELLYTAASHEDDSNATMSDLGLNVNAFFKIPVVGLYAGAGLGFHFLKAEYDGTEIASDEKLGYQIMAGYQIDLPAIKPFIEARYTNVDSDGRIDLLVGVNLGF